MSGARNRNGLGECECSDEWECRSNVHFEVTSGDSSYVLRSFFEIARRYPRRCNSIVGRDQCLIS